MKLHAFMKFMRRDGNAIKGSCHVAVSLAQPVMACCHAEMAPHGSACRNVVGLQVVMQNRLHMIVHVETASHACRRLLGSLAQ